MKRSFVSDFSLFLGSTLSSMIFKTSSAILFLLNAVVVGEMLFEPRAFVICEVEILQQRELYSESQKVVINSLRPLCSVQPLLQTEPT